MRRHVHSRGSFARSEGDIVYQKGLDVSEKGDKIAVSNEILEGIEEYEKEKREESDPFKESYISWDQWDQHAIRFALNHFAPKKAKSAAPFTPFQELSTVRRIPSSEKGLPLGLQRQLQKERLEEFKERLRYQQEGISGLIRRLHELVYQNPDIPPKKLYQELDRFSNTHGFDKAIEHGFVVGIGDYWQKRRAVKQALARYPDKNDLFAVCFGKKPHGKVDIIQGPMTVMFRCYDDSDYVLAYHFGKTGGDMSKLNTEEVKQALASGGAALRKVGIPSLAGTVILENAAYVKPAVRFREENIQIKKDIYVENINDVTLVEITRSDSRRWRMIVRRDEDGKAQRIQLSDSQRSGYAMDIVWHESDDPSDSGWRQANEPDTPLSQSIFKLGEHAFLSVKGRTLSILDASEGGLQLRVGTFKMQEAKLNQEWSDRVRLHEEQHQWNALFKPVEVARNMRGIIQYAIEHGTSVQEARTNVLHALVHQQRRVIGVDSAARDEILSFYKDGRRPHDILQILLHNPLYNYKEKEYYKAEIGKIPIKINACIDYLLKASSPDGYAIRDYLKLCLAKTSAEELDPYIDTVFGKEYKEDLKRWANCVSDLEKKGYTRDEVGSLLYMYPASEWVRVARRFPPKTQAA